MYGPPPCRKRKVRRQVGLRKCIRPLVEFVTPGQDGMRYALFLFNCSILKTAWRIRLGERRVRPLCHLIVRQQPWQETLLDRRRWAVDVGIAMRSPSLTLGRHHLQAG
jgi:hypothetical protein